MLTDKKSALIILRGGVLSAAFSFIFFISPIFGVIFHFLALAPLFYVGLRLRLNGFIVASSFPLSGIIATAGIFGGMTFLLTCVAPSALILYWHFYKKGRNFSYSRAEILHNFSKLFLVGIIGLLFFAWASNRDILSIFGMDSENIKRLSDISPATNNVIELLPGISSFMLMLIIWLNYQIAYAFSLKVQKIRAIDNAVTSLPNFWDIILVSSLWLYLLQKLMLHSSILNIASKTILCVSFFPLMVEGLDIFRLMARFYKISPLVYFIILSFVFLLVYPLVFVVALGLVEPWYGLKQRYIKS